MIRYIKKGLFIIIISMLLTGCYSSEERALAKQYEKQGKNYAINYVKEKYGFKAKVKTAKTIRSCNTVWGCFDSEPSGNVNVELRVNKKKFTVRVMGLDDGEIRAADNYQHEEIKNDLLDYFKSNIPLNLYDYKINDLVLITEYYDDNLEDMLQYINEVELYFIGENDLSTLNLNKIENFWKNNYNLKLINFKTKEKCEKYKDAKIENVSLASDKIKDIYIDNIIKIKNGTAEFYQVDNITNYKNQVYVYAYKDNSSHSIALSTIDTLNNYQQSYTELNDRKIEQVTNAYSILSTPSVLYIYFPKEEINSRNSNNLFFAYECNVNQERKYYIDNYFGLETKLKMGTDGNNYISMPNFSNCDVNSEVIFSLIKIY